MVGMGPLALALERGSQMQAPLGLAVIGGLVSLRTKKLDLGITTEHSICANVDQPD
jgi:hypothetical protein